MRRIGEGGGEQRRGHGWRVEVRAAPLTRSHPTHPPPVQVVTIFFGSFVAGSFFNQAKAYVEDPKGAIKSIGLAAPQASTFFLTYVGIKTFFQPAFKHLRIIPFIIYSLRTKLAASDRVKNRLFSNEFPKYNVEVPYMSLIALLGLVFCAINPIMPPLCLVYFAVMYFFIK